MRRHKLFIVMSLFLIILSVFRNDLIILVDAYFFTMFVNLVYLVINFCYFVLLVVSVIYILYSVIKHFTKSTKIVMPSIFIWSFLVFCLLINSMLYGVFNFRFYEDKRVEIIEGYKQETFGQKDSEKLIGINTNKYISPYRFVSFQKKFYIDNKDEVIKAVFYVSDLSKIVYISNDNIDEEGLFKDLEYLNNYNYIKKLDKCWYYVR